VDQLLSLFLLVELWKRRFSNASWLAVIAAAVLLPPLLTAWLVYGHFLPQSLLAKSHHTGQPLFYVIKSFLAPDLISICILPLAILGGFTSIRNRKKTLSLLTIWTILYVGSYSVARPVVFSWYVAPVQLAICLLAGVGVSTLVQRLRISSPVHVTTVFALAIVSVWAAVLLAKGESSVTTNVYRPLKAWCHGIGPHNGIFATDIGVLGYYCDGRIYDRAGLIWPEALSFDSALEIIQAHDPDYLFVNATSRTLRLINTPEIKEKYRPIERFSPAGATTLTLGSDANVKWHQDYLLLEMNRLR